MKPNRRLSPRQEALNERALYLAILTLRTPEELKSFFRDLCTPAELQALTDRWAVAMKLQDRIPYPQLQRETGISVTTIGRVARYLHAGHGGYAVAAARRTAGHR